MKTPLDKKKKVTLAIIGLLPMVILARAGYVFLTGEYHGQPRFGPAIHFTGFDAYMMGLAYVFLGLMILCAMLLELGADKKKVAIGCVLMLAGAAASFLLTF